MDAYTQELFDNYFNLFRTKGWTQFIENTQSNLDALPTIENLKTLEDLYKTKGNKEILTRIVNFEGLIKDQYEELTSEDE